MLVQSAKSAEDDAEIAELFSGDLAPERKAYEPQIRKMWEQDQYRHLSAQDIYRILSYEAAGARAVEAHKAAEKDAKESSTGGNNSSANRTGKGARQMTDEELLANNERIMAGKGA